MARPPRLSSWLLARTLGWSRHEFLLGDLDEEFMRRAGRAPVRARLWYTRQAFLAVWHVGFRARHRGAAHPVRQGDSMARQIRADVRYALRLLVRQPFYSAVAVSSLALAVAANGLVFGLVDNLVLNPFSFPDGDRLVSVGSTFPRLSADEGFIEQHSPAEIDDMRRADSLVHVAAFDLGNRAVSTPTSAENAFTALIVDDPLPAMGQPPALGRGFTAEELTPGGPSVAIISHGLWTRLYGAAPDIIGRAILVNSQARTVVGVTARESSLLGSDLWIPWGGQTTAVPRNRRQFTVIARLAPGVSLAAANTELSTVALRTTTEFGGQFPEYEGWRLRAVTWTEALTGQARGPAMLLLGAGLLVLLIACANVTSLMLTRLTARRREIAVRLALGAGTMQVARLLTIESLAIAGLATAIGLLAAQAAIGPVVAMLPNQIANFGSPEIDLRVIGYAALVGLLAALVTPLVPVVQARRPALQDALRDGGTSTVGRQRLRTALVVAELTLAVVLLVGASLLLRSYARIQNVDPGFRSDQVLTMRMTVAWERFSGAGAAQEFFADFIGQLRALPEVETAAATSQFPPQLSFSMQFRVDGAPQTTETLPNAAVTVISSGYFDVLGVALRHGRLLDDRDRAGAPTAVVVNEAFAARFLDGASSGRLLVGAQSTAAEVVGVVADTRNNTLLRPPQPEMFVTMEQAGANNQFFLIVRTTTEPMAALPAIRRTLTAMNPDQPLYLIQTLDQAIAGSLASQRISLALVAAFAAGALIVACVGVYGIVSYWVATRAREIGIRIALGASARQVMALVVGETSRLVAMGLLFGLVGGVLLGQLARTQLYETTPVDPVALAGVVAILAFVSLLAGYLPARRALGVNPVTVLRSE
ncbi:MAG TPA: ADOP family duplicated permease [Vicinamibacterales bacterium]|nr:ADOP family duplicated permease [Vicinamibacterales bacterium]